MLSLIFSKNVFTGSCGFIEQYEEESFGSTMCGEICHANPFRTGTFFCEKDEKCCPSEAFSQTCSLTCGPYNISGTLLTQLPSDILYIQIVQVLIAFLNIYIAFLYLVHVENRIFWRLRNRIYSRMLQRSRCSLQRRMPP